jgi:hypothetical protein
MLPLLAGLLVMAGCSSMRENPDGAFAPRPENATSDSYQLVRLDENRYHGGLDKASLLMFIDRYRKDYEVIKPASDFAQDHDNGIRYQQYLDNVQSFKDSKLDAAERYLKSLPEAMRFTRADLDPKTYDIGDINWRDTARKLRVVDFYAQYSSDDWSPYAFIINLLPPAKNGYGKLALSVNGETLYFRKKMRKKIWSFAPNYFWVYAYVLTLDNSADQAPMLLIINDPNDHGDMNGTYLVMPQADIAEN